MTSQRPFSTSWPLLKNRRQEDNHSSAAKSKNNKSAPITASEATAEASGDPLDFSAVTEAYASFDNHFKTQIQTVVHGGRFNPAQLGALPVKMTIKPEDGGDGTTLHTFPLRELAQVVPRSGRTISLLLNDKSYIKPIMSAVQNSPDFNQQPQRSEDNELELLLRMELERREELVKRIKEASKGWRERVRQARTKHEKLLKDGKKKGTVLPDVLRKADKELQKMQDKKMKEIDGEEAAAVKQLERN
jgi:ribosome recycling factor